MDSDRKSNYLFKKSNKLNDVELISSFENAKIDLDSIKEKFNVKYNKLKEKCFYLKKQKNEKENFIKVSILIIIVIIREV